jgi:N-acetylmuramic acid 6-phosphate etherase
MGDTNDDTYENFMRVCGPFKLGDLVTESPNPISSNLSDECAMDMAKGLTTLQNVDRAAMEQMMRLPAVTSGLVEEMAGAIHRTFLQGKKVFFVGCGATGRLSLSLEVFGREGMLEPQYRDQVRGFMAGGDVALIRSIEKFEDREEYGRQQLRDLGYQDGDLIIAITEGGETPFVIAACEEGVALSPSQPVHYFLYCNPDDTLCRLAERSKRVIENPRIRKLNLTHGPMAVTGSTRMQATTVQLLVAGLALQYHSDPSKIRQRLQRAADALTSAVDYSVLAPFSVAEAAFYREGQFFTYATDFFTCTVMTDTTERSPTFSFPAFENFDVTPHPPPSPVYMHLPGCRDSKEAWSRMLHREPRGIDWPETQKQTAASVLYGYDFSDRCVAERRKRYGEQRTLHSLSVNRTDRGIAFAVLRSNVSVEVALDVDLLSDVLLSNIVCKALLNAHSTAIMAHNGRLRGNVMIYVRPTNNKLIDRSARYVRLILEHENATAEARSAAPVMIPDYAEIVRLIYEIRAVAPVDQPIVLLVANRIKAEAGVTITSPVPGAAPSA